MYVPLYFTDGKEIFKTSANSVCKRFNIDYQSVAAAMNADEIPDDVKTLIQQLNDLVR
jgi:hypothetical protein